MMSNIHACLCYSSDYCIVVDNINGIFIHNVTCSEYYATTSYFGSIENVKLTHESTRPLYTP